MPTASTGTVLACINTTALVFLENVFVQFLLQPGAESKESLADAAVSAFVEVIYLQEYLAIITARRKFECHTWALRTVSRIRTDTPI